MSGKHTGTSLFGWCLDGFHDQCQATATNPEVGDLACGCRCHAKRG